MSTDTNVKIIVTMIDDDEARHRAIAPWVPPDTRMTWIGSAGVALGMLRAHDIKTAVRGILLDYDLVDPRDLRYGEKPLTGLDIARKMVETLDPDLPVLVHSMSRERDQAINMLRTAGFPVTQIPFAELSKENFNKWLDEVRDRYEYYQQN